MKTIPLRRPTQKLPATQCCTSPNTEDLLAPSLASISYFVWPLVALVRESDIHQVGLLARSVIIE